VGVLVGLLLGVAIGSVDGTLDGSLLVAHRIEQVGRLLLADHGTKVGSSDGESDGSFAEATEGSWDLLASIVRPHYHIFISLQVRNLYFASTLRTRINHCY